MMQNRKAEGVSKRPVGRTARLKNIGAALYYHGVDKKRKQV